MIGYSKVSRVAKSDILLFYFIDIVDTVDREDTPNQKTDTNMFREKEDSEKSRKNQLDIVSKAYKERIRYFHKFLYQKIESYCTDSADSYDEKSAEKGKIFIGMIERKQIIDSEEYSDNGCRNYSTIHEFHRSKLCFLCKDEITRITCSTQKDKYVSSDIPNI